MSFSESDHPENATPEAFQIKNNRTTRIREAAFNMKKFEFLVTHPNGLEVALRQTRKWRTPIENPADIFAKNEELLEQTALE